MTKQFITDEGMKIFYKGIAKIDPDECILIEKPISQLEISLEGESLSMHDFVKKNVKLVTIDHFSTKKVNDEAIASSKMPQAQADFLKKFYVEYFRQWGIIEYQNKKVGIADSATVYNGFPNLIDSEELINSKDPGKMHQEAIERLIKRADLQDASIKPIVYGRTNISLHRDFLSQNPVYEK